MKMYYEQEINQQWIQGKKVAVIGYGSQGFAHSNNLRDSGVEVCVGLRKDSASVKKARAAGLKVMTGAEASEWADVIMVLKGPHETQDLLSLFAFHLHGVFWNHGYLGHCVG